MTATIPNEVIEVAAKAYYRESNAQVGLPASEWDADERAQFIWATGVIAPLIWNAAVDAVTDEMVDAFAEAWEARRKEIGRGIAPKGTKTRAGLEAALAAIRVEEEQ